MESLGEKGILGSYGFRGDPHDLMSRFDHEMSGYVPGYRRLYFNGNLLLKIASRIGIVGNYFSLGRRVYINEKLCDDDRFVAAVSGSVIVSDNYVSPFVKWLLLCSPMLLFIAIVTAASYYSQYAFLFLMLSPLSLFCFRSFRAELYLRHAVVESAVSFWLTGNFDKRATQRLERDLCGAMTLYSVNSKKEARSRIRRYYSLIRAVDTDPSGLNILLLSKVYMIAYSLLTGEDRDDEV